MGFLIVLRFLPLSFFGLHLPQESKIYQNQEIYRNQKIGYEFRYVCMCRHIYNSKYIFLSYQV